MSNNSAVIIKNNFLIETSGKIDFTGLKLFNSLYHFAYNEILDKDIHIISSSQIAEYLGYTNKITIKHIKKSLFSLMNYTIEWDIFDERSGEEIFGGSTLLASYEFKGGVCEFAFSPHLRKRLLADTLYTKINLRLQNLFSGKYSIRMYELAKEFYREKDGIGETRFISLEKFRSFLGVEDGKYPSFKIFNQKILSPAIAEVNRLSEINIEVVFEKFGTKVKAIKLKVKRNHEHSEFKNLLLDQAVITIDQQENKTIETKSSTIKKPYTNIVEREDSFYRDKEKPIKTLSISITSLGIKQTQIDNWLEKYDLEYIQAKLDLTIAQIKAGKIKNTPSGFLVRAIEEDYGTKVSLDEIVEKEAVEARKLNPETCLVDPFDFDSFEAFQAKVEELKTQYYNPFFIQSEVEAAGRGKWGK